MSVELDELGPVSVKRTCPLCGARTILTSAFCSQCHEPFDDFAPEDEEPQAPIEEHPEVPMVVNYRYSRWRKGATTFGPLGRVTASIVCVAPCAWFFQTLPPIGIVWIVTVWPVALGSIWKRTRVA